MKKVIVIFSSFLLLFSCSVDNKKKEAEEDVFCTEEYRSVTLTVTDKDNRSVGLDSIKTFVDGKAIPVLENFQSMEYIEMKIKGEYLVCSDSDKEAFDGKVKKVSILGYLNNKVIFEKETEIGADKCHIYMPDNESMSLNVKINNMEFGCDQAFHSILVEVKYQDGSPVLLDKYKVLLDGEDITSSLSDSGSAEYRTIREDGKYMLMNDNLAKKLQGSILTATFIGYRNEKEIVKEDFYVAADNCYVLYPDSFNKPLGITVKK